MNRHFTQIKEFPEYYITKKGKIYSKKSNKILNQSNGYVVLYENGIRHFKSVEKLIRITYKNID